MEKKELLYEGKAKKVYTTEDPDVLIVDYKDDATAFNGLSARWPNVKQPHFSENHDKSQGRKVCRLKSGVA